jgi:hypothetical protein
MRIKQYLLNENVLVFLFCLGILAGPSTTVLLNYELQKRCTDCNTYKGIANLDFNQKNGVRRYRIIIPLIAAAVNNVIAEHVEDTKPNYFHGNFSLPVSFFLINIFLFCCYGVAIYRTCIAFDTGVAAALIGVLLMLSCRWTPYLAATPMIDSLYCLVTALVLLGLRTGNNKLIILSIFLGPFAKESFIFFLPLIFFYANISKPKLLLLFVASGLIMVMYRYTYEHLAGLPEHSGAKADWGQWNYFKRYWLGLFSPRELFKLTFNIGVWLVIPLYGIFFIKNFLRDLGAKLPGYIPFFVVVVFFHMLFGGYDRHFYLATPAICVVIALSADALFRKLKITAPTADT